jgi:hypothetical protein
MAKVNPDLLKAFKSAIEKLKNGAHYEWGHMGACNCGHLAQEITKLSKAEIHQFAMQKRGDWNEQIVEYCPTSGYPMDLLISTMLDAGLTLDELAHLEKLSLPEVLTQIPLPKRHHLNKNNREDVVLYMETWLEILEQKWIEKEINALNTKPFEKNAKKLIHKVLA